MYLITDLCYLHITTFLKSPKSASGLKGFREGGVDLCCYLNFVAALGRGGSYL